jgi:hypothetical protein
MQPVYFTCVFTFEDLNTIILRWLMGNPDVNHTESSGGYTVGVYGCTTFVRLAISYKDGIQLLQDDGTRKWKRYMIKVPRIDIGQINQELA